MDLGGRPRGRGDGAAVEAMLVSAPVRARIAGIVRADFGGRPRFFGNAGVEKPTVEERETSPLRNEDATGRRAGVGAPTVELRETLPACLRGEP